MNEFAAVLLTGVGATAVMDLWGLARQPLLSVPRPDYAMLGRWVGHMGRGCFRHAAIAKAAPVRAERLLGWLAHYAIGIGFAALLVALAGTGWLRQPTLLPALAVGVGTVLAPFLVMQPAMGAGIASSRTPRPGAARLQSLLTHLAFGTGLYLAGLAASFLLAP